MKMRLVSMLALLVAVNVPAQADLATGISPWCQADDQKPEEGKTSGQEGKGERKGAAGEQTEPECD
ncbi:MAG: hypothetical protein LJE84_05725 [Gammaproteobacteria bacterium]|jgi:hypothetical protein|nr:hypothetical protein [Gammaproteobacteria bacterium]